MSFMPLNIIILLLSLGIILLGCELFVNGIEWLGVRLKMGDGVVGSLFSAVATCLPESSIPIIAIISSKQLDLANDISIGAIAGAPFMLGTLAFFMTGLSVLVFLKKRKTGLNLCVNTGILKRDLWFFIFSYSLGISSSFFTSISARKAVAVFLPVFYLFYVLLTIREDRESHVKPERLLMRKITRVKSNKSAVVLQLLLSFTGIILGAELFVRNISLISKDIGISALVLALVIAPVATELPEKFNSIIWTRKNRDTLALGNITGAMVFQSCIPVSIGIVATSWELDGRVLASAALAVLSALTNILWVEVKGKLNVFPLLAGGVFYAVFILSLLG
jgi:cation:H+ antiporter